MKIAWSCAGEGFGHAARMVALEPYLSPLAELELFVPPKVRRYVRERLPGRRLHWVPAFGFDIQCHRVRHLRTAFAGAGLLASLPRIASRLAARLQSLGCEAIVSDFDPFLAWAGKILGLPVIQFNHPGIIQSHHSLLPRRLASILATRVMEGPYDRRLLTSFYEAPIGPIIREGLMKAKRTRGDYLVLNLKPDLLPVVEPVVRDIGIPFLVFPGRSGYDEALAGCRAVISGAGHQTMAEALFLGKPLLAIPQSGQYEQRLNARMLRRSGGGMATTVERFPTDLPVFLSRLDEFRVDQTGPWRTRAGNSEAASAIVSAIAAVRRSRERSRFVADMARAHMPGLIYP